MNTRLTNALALAALAAAVVAVAPPAAAMIHGLSGSAYSLTAREGYVSLPDGASIYMWGYADGAGPMQYPGPTLIVDQGATVSITLTNTLDEPVSMVFPGQGPVAAVGGQAGVLAQEAAKGQAVTYTFTAASPGTFTYYSGSRPDVQVEMGLVGALIVRPVVGGQVAANQAYEHAATAFDREYLFLMTEIDPRFHLMMRFGLGAVLDTSDFEPRYWLLNGRAAPDTMDLPDVAWLPSQPYNCMPMAHPGDRVLMRLVSAGRDLHPFHHHGNHALVIAQDGRMLQSTPGAGPDLAYWDFTQSVAPGGTQDAIFTWTGHGLGWDLYGHAPGDALAAGEDPADHGKPFPVQMPNVEDLVNGEMWSGSPFLGGMATLPPGQGKGNEHGSFFFMWHSHTEKEMVNNNVFPGGMMTMLLIEHPDVEIHEHE